MKALILQMRGKDDPNRMIEQQEYLRYTGLAPGQINFVDLYDHPDLNPGQLLQHDMLLIGGISRDKVDELHWPESRFPFIHNLRALMNLAINKKIPALLSCGAFAIAGDMLGAETLRREEGFELGVYPLWKTTAAENDLFLGPVSDGLQMVSGHVKYFSKTPPGTELLFYTNTYARQVPVQAFKVIDAPFYAFQGHPEVSCKELAERFRPITYREHYFPKRPGNIDDEKKGYNEDAFQATFQLVADTSEAQGLLLRFVGLVEGGFLGD